VVATWRDRLERGEDVDPAPELAAYPHAAERLQRTLAALRLLARAYPPRAAPESAGLAAGATLGGYRLLERIGAGGMGTVWRAEGGSGVVALKVVHQHLLGRKGFRARFEREVAIGRRIRHANVVATHDCGAAQEGGRTWLYLAMEYVEGRTLRTVADELTRLPEELCRHVGREVARGLAAIHAAGAVHRDLKAENVLITREHAVKIMDLGVAHVAGASTRLSQTGAFIGSILCAAPEQFGPPLAKGAADPVDHRADLHALGALLYELATGAHPFQGDDFRTVVRRVLDETPRRAADLNPQISPFLDELVAQLLEKDRAKRPEDAGAVAAVLEQGEESAWWAGRAAAIREATRRPLRRIRIARETALHGRDRELAALRSLYDRAARGDGQVALVEGEAGIGKSRLVDEFVTALRRSGEDFDFLFGGYPPAGAATASGAFITAYGEHFGADEAAMAAALPQTPLLVPAFRALLAGDAPPASAERLTTQSVHSVFVHATRSLAAVRPTIVLIDDLHFAPDAGRALFAALALGAAGHRILLIGSARPETDAAWLGSLTRAGAARVHLERLGAKDLVGLLHDALKSQHLAEELAGKIAAKSDGNPFFAFEILRALREGLLLTRRGDGTWIRTSEIREIVVPSSIVELVQARISALGLADRNLLEAAACAGFEFDPSIVGAVLDAPRIPLLQRLGQIEKAHRLVRSVGRRFVFDHHQVQEVLYAGLSEPLREAYHGALGAAIEAQSGAAARDPPALDGALCADLAGHFLAGARGERALRYLDAALEHLARGYLNESAARLAARALAVPGLLNGARRAELLLRRAGRLSIVGRPGEESADLEEALALAAASGDRLLRVRAMREMGHFLGRASRFAEAERTLLDAAALAGDDGDPDAQIPFALGGVYSDQGRLAEARAQYEMRCARARERGNRAAEASALGNIAIVLLAEGRHDEAIALEERSAAMAGEGDRRAAAISGINLGNMHWAEGRLDEARQHYDRAVTGLRAVGDRHGEAIAIGNLGNLHLSLGQVDEARRHYEHGLALARDIGARRVEGYWLNALGQVAAMQDRDEEAESAFRAAIALREEIAYPSGLAESRAGLGDLLARRGRVEEARSALEGAVAAARQSGLVRIEVSATACLAALPGGDAAAAEETFARLASRADAETKFEALVQLFRATGRIAHLAEAKRLSDECLARYPAHREAMLANHRYHREIAALAREHGLV
jgi:tetratricopeptide (TPR) repeat protein